MIWVKLGVFIVLLLFAVWYSYRAKKSLITVVGPVLICMYEVIVCLLVLSEQSAALSLWEKLRSLPIEVLLVTSIISIMRNSKADTEKDPST